MNPPQPRRHRIELGLLQTDPAGYARESVVSQFLRGAHTQGFPTMLFAVSSMPARCGRHEVWATPLQNVANEAVIEGTRALYWHISNESPVGRQFLFSTETSDYFKNEGFRELCRELNVVPRPVAYLPVLRSL